MITKKQQICNISDVKINKEKTGWICIISFYHKYICAAFFP